MERQIIIYTIILYNYIIQMILESTFSVYVNFADETNERWYAIF